MIDYVNINNFKIGDSPVANVDYSQIMTLLSTYALFVGLISILVIVEMWIIYKKAGKPGWAAIVPIYNMWVFFEIADLPGWLSLIPVANFVGMLVAYFKIPKKFGKSGAFGLGILLLPIIFLGVLAFSKVKNDNTETTTSEMTNDTPAMSNVPTDNQMSNENTVPDLMAAAPSINNNEINTVVEEKTFVQEEPGLNLSESVPEEIPSIMPTTNNEQTPINEEPINAFEMPSPVETNVNQDVSASEPVNTTMESSTPITDSLEQNIFNNAVSDIPVLEEIPTLSETPVETTSVLNEEPITEELEMPKMVNEVVNNDITEKKICKNCSHENPYTSKFCEMCGNVLE